MSEKIRTQEPQELDIPMSTEALQVMAELTLPARIDAVAARVAGLKPKVSKAIAANLKEATAEIAKSTRVAELRQAGPSLRVIYGEYARDRAAREPAILADTRLSNSGKQEELRKLEVARDTRISRLQTQVGQSAHLTRIWYQPPAPPPLTQASSMQGMLFASLFPHAPADTALADIGNWVDAASDAGAANETRQDAIALLYHVGRPLLARRAIAPEKHSEPFQGSYQDMQGIVDELIESWGERPHRRIAITLAAQAERDFTYARNMAEEYGWDSSIEAATAELFEW